MSNTPPVTSSFEINIQSLVDGLAKAVKVIQDFQDKVSGSGFKVPLGPSEQEFAKMQAGFKGISDGIGKLLNDFSALSASASSAFATASQQATNLITEIAQANDVAKELADNVKKTQGGGKKDATEGIFGKFPTRDEFLAILGASKLIGGEVGQIIRGLDFMLVGARSFGGALFGAVGILAEISQAVIKIGIEESKLIVDEKNKADAIGITLVQFQAIKKVVEENGKDVSVLNQLFRNVSEAVEGVGKNASTARASVEAILGHDIPEGASKFDIYVELSDRLAQLAKQGVATSAVMADLGGRGAVEAAGAFAKLSSEARENVTAMEAQGRGSAAMIEKAQQTTKALADLDEQWHRLRENLIEPVSVIIKFVADISPEVGNIISFLTKSDSNPLNEFKNVMNLGKVFSSMAAQTSNSVFGTNFATLGGGGSATTATASAPSGGGPKITASDTADKTRQAQELIASIQTDKALRIKAIAEKELELKLVTEQITQAQTAYNKDNEQLELAKKAGETAEQLAARVKQVHDAETRLLGFTIAKEQTEKEIRQLRKNPNIEKAADLQSQVEDIKEQMAQLNPLDDKFLELGDKKRELLLAAAGLFGSSGEDDAVQRETATRKQAEKERIADLRAVNAEIISQLEKGLAEGRAGIARVASDAEEGQKEDFEALKRAFSTGAVGISGLFTAEVQSVDEKVNTVIEARKAQIAKIEAARAKLVEIQNIEGFTRKTTDEITKLDQEKEAQTTEITKLENKGALEIIKIQDDLKAKRLATIDQIGKIELQETQNHNREMLAEEARAAQVSLAAKEKYMQDKLAAEETEAKQELDNLLTHAIEQKDAITDVIKDSTGRAIGATISSPEFVKNATAEQVQSVLESLKGANPVDANAEQLKTYQSIIAALEKILLLKQQEKFVTQDIITLEEKNALTMLDEQIKKETILLNLQEQRNKLLDSFGKLTPEQVRRQQAAVSAERISLNDSELSSLAQKFSIAMADAQRKAPGASQAELFRSNPELSKLNEDMLKLASTNALLRTSFELTNSVLGVLASNLDELANKVGASTGPLKGLAPAVKGLADLVKLLDKANVEKNDPATRLKDGGDYVYKSLVAGADYFRDSQIEGGNGQATLSPAANKAIVDTHAFIKQAISSLTGGLAGLVQGLGASTTGGRVSGFGGGLGSLLGLAGGSVAAAAPVVGIVANIAGSIIDTIGNIWKERAQKIASNLETDFKAITAKFQEGTISLGQTINDLNAEMGIARDQLTHGKIGKKGGNAQFQAIQQQVGQQIAQLQLQAQQTQNDFLGKLQDLRSTTPASIGTRTSIDDAISQVRKFLNSFDSASAAAAHMGEAQEFLATTLGNMKTQLDQQISDQINQQNASARAFAQSEKNIIDSGRVQTQFQAAQNKVRQLFEQEANRAIQVQQEQRSMKALTDQADALSTGFDRVSKVLNRIADQLEAAFTASAQKNAGVGAFAGVTPGSLSASAAGLTSSLTASSTSSMSFSANISIASGSAQEAAGIVGDEIESRLAQLGIANLTTGRINRSRPFQP